MCRSADLPAKFGEERRHVAICGATTPIPVMTTRFHAAAALAASRRSTCAMCRRRSRRRRVAVEIEVEALLGFKQELQGRQRIDAQFGQLDSGATCSARIRPPAFPDDGKLLVVIETVGRMPSVSVTNTSRRRASAITEIGYHLLGDRDAFWRWRRTAPRNLRTAAAGPVLVAQVVVAECVAERGKVPYRWDRARRMMRMTGAGALVLPPMASSSPASPGGSAAWIGSTAASRHGGRRVRTVA